MHCTCCNSKDIKSSPLFLKGFYLCKGCGLIFQNGTGTDSQTDNVVRHYQNSDPHETVALSKKIFFEFALKSLRSKIGIRNKKILDVGCGYGYFLKMALSKGWGPQGVEVAEDAVSASREKIGSKNVFHGDLKSGCLEEESFDAITLWDVLVMVNNPYEELKECRRILKQNGIIGIRLRNVVFQKWAYCIHLPFKRIYRKFGVKHPTVFHPFCFSPRSIRQLLQKTGFTNIRIENSPLTSGDPYSYGIGRVLVPLTKEFIHLISNLVFTISRGRWIIGPSLLIWAEKP
jgi:2-polyprenyl-3-methyl-5-hydroxy-6-metoxy-1,4-benzoquinol methylase